MIARRDGAVEEQAAQLRLFLGNDVAFFSELSDYLVEGRLASLDAASRKMPGLTDGENASVLIEDGGLDAYRDRPRRLQIEVTQARLKLLIHGWLIPQ
jgi:hypothetical protein